MEGEKKVFESRTQLHSRKVILHADKHSNGAVKDVTFYC